MTTSLSDFKSPKHKIFAILHAGRDKWKAKHHQVKMTLKLAEHQVRAVSKSRENWRDRALEAERQLRCVRADLKNSAPEC